MQESDRPDAGSASGDGGGLTEDQGISRLEGIFASLPEDEEGPGESQVQTEPGKEQPEAQAEGEVEPGAETDEAAGDGDEAPEQEAEAEAETESEAIDIADDTEIDLGNGERISFAQLKETHLKGEERIKGFQREHTEKSMQLSNDRKAVESKAQEILAEAQRVKQDRETFFATVNQFLPQPPQEPQVSAEQDPYSWTVYSEQKAKYDKQVQQVQRAYQEHHNSVQTEQRKQAEQFNRWASEQRDTLFKVRPELANDATRQKVNAELVETFRNAYGIASEEIAQVVDARQIQVMLDALEYRKLQASKPQAKAKLEGKPKVLRSGKTVTAKEKSSRDRADRVARLRKTGSPEDAIEVLKGFEL